MRLKAPVACEVGLGGGCHGKRGYLSLIFNVYFAQLELLLTWKHVTLVI